MRVSIVPIGEFDLKLARLIGRGIEEIILETDCRVIENPLELPAEYYNLARRQYNSTLLLHKLELETLKYTSDRVLGVTEADIYVPGMNFVFGEAKLWGRCCLISIFRLKPEFYGSSPDQSILLERCVKESIHELGHTLGLQHCSVESCVMHFSVSIHWVDRKEAEFCADCKAKIEKAIRGK